MVLAGLAWAVPGGASAPVAAIDAATEEPNDFARFYDEHPGVHTVFFNGRKAHDSYARRVLPLLAPHHAEHERVLLPSTSPAHASMTRAAKLEQWTAVRAALELGA